MLMVDLWVIPQEIPHQQTWELVISGMKMILVYIMQMRSIRTDEMDMVLVLNVIFELDCYILFRTHFSCNST